MKRFETLNIDAAALGRLRLAEVIGQPTAKSATITIPSGSGYFRYDSGNASPTVGHFAGVGTVIDLRDADEIKFFNFYASTATSLVITYDCPEEY